MSYLMEFVGLIGTVVLIAWFFARRLKKSTDPGALIVKWVITVSVVSFWVYLGRLSGASDPLTTFLYVCVAAMSAVFIGVIWAPHIGDFIASPFSRLYDGGDAEPELRPLYSIAKVHCNRGHYDKAVAEIRKQLANFPEDFEGWILLAEVQVKDLNDLNAGLETIDHILTLPDLAPKNAAYALGRAADWQLERADPEGARFALEKILQRLPDTAEAQVAAQRIAHIASPEHLAAKHAPRLLVVQHNDEHIGLRTEAMAAPASEDPAATAHAYLEHLRDHPLDNEVREKLAMLYAREFQRLDLATAELEQLITTPNQTPKNIAHWLNMLADFQIRLANDIGLARETLQRIIDLNPGSAAANNAAVRLSQLRLELNQNASQRTVKLGNYEQNIGLKRMTSGGVNE
jgi:tetratricopeptide (TPR) repeat protein